MLKLSRWLLLSFALGLVTASAAASPDSTQTPSIADKTSGMQKLGGYFNLYWDAKQGKLWLEIDKWNAEFLYQSGLSAGIGSNDIGLDRGQLGETRIVRFERIGPKVLLIQENLDYRAVSNDADERRAVHDSFAESALWGFTVAAEEKDHALVDATDFFLRDAHGVPEALRRSKQGAYHLDASRCAIDLTADKEFSAEHGSGSHADLRGRRAWRVGSPGDAVSAVHHRARASFLRAASACRLQAARLRSAFQLFRHQLYGLRHANRRTDCEALHRAAPLGKERSAGSDERARATYRLLPGPRRAGADSLRAARRRALVESGVRSRGIQECLPRGADAGRRGSHGPALQRDPVGASRHARVVVWRGRHRSAHGRNHQGTRHAGIAARTAGLPHSGRSLGAV